jgi:hypothetical protein
MLTGEHVVNFSRVDPAHAELDIPILGFLQGTPDAVGGGVLITQPGEQRP